MNPSSTTPSTVHRVLIERFHRSIGDFPCVNLAVEFRWHEGSPSAISRLSYGPSTRFSAARSSPATNTHRRRREIHGGPAPEGGAGRRGSRARSRAPLQRERGRARVRPRRRRRARRSAEPPGRQAGGRPAAKRRAAQGGQCRRRCDPRARRVTAAGLGGHGSAGTLIGGRRAACPGGPRLASRALGPRGPGARKRGGPPPSLVPHQPRGSCVLVSCPSPFREHLDKRFEIKLLVTVQLR